MTRNSADDVLEKAFESLRTIPMPDKGEQVARRTAFLAQARGYRGLAAPASRGVRHPLGIQPLHQFFSRKPAMLNVLAALAIIVAIVAGTGGVAYAADGAVPGDPLYGIDRSVESIRLSLTTSPQATIGLLLAYANERLLEAEALPGQANEQQQQVALSDYGETLATLAQTLATVEAVDRPALAALLDETLSAHEDKLAGILGTDDEGRPESCAGRESHPVAQRLAETYGPSLQVSYDQVMGWFCKGYGFGEIMHALVTAELEPDRDPEALLAEKTELGGWGKVWQELELIGPPSDKDVGPPDDKDKGQSDDTNVGPPDDKDKEQSDDKDVGPPDDKDKGQSDNKDKDQLDDKPVGPPADKDVGPPDDKPEKPDKPTKATKPEKP